jgi:hypothetical protein
MEEYFSETVEAVNLELEKTLAEKEEEKAEEQKELESINS